ncbi:MAG TPA: SpoIVB peptidase S55 domain-containing protein [Terriglobia bacterium]|nr:SpoIVB peptidase S55 domain-containing protein [Terriglobia bacterium]
MKTKNITIAVVLCILGAIASAGVRAETPAPGGAFFPVDEIRAGMKGVGRTVFEGTAISEFQVDILGVLKNYGPKQDLILARLSGGPLDRTGVIQGMSGSPVYVDNRLVGAVAFAFPFSKEPIAGIQPIGQMLSLLGPSAAGNAAQPGGGAPAARPGFAAAESPAAYMDRLLARARSGGSLAETLAPETLSANAALAGSSMARIQTPLSISGVSPAAIRELAPFFNAFGFSPVQSGGTGSVLSTGQDKPERLAPGSPVSAELARGDISVSASGTVTYVDGDRIYAFGHPYLSAGPLSLPMSTAYVISLLPKLDNSMKITTPLNVVGAFTEDRSTGIAGMVGAVPDMIPVVLNVKSGKAAANDYRFEIARDKVLTPALMNLAVFSAITASERELGEMTLTVSGQVQLKNNDPIRISNVYSSDMNGATLTSIATVAPLQYLMTSGFDYSGIERINLDIVSAERKASVTLDRISVDRNEVKPGEDVTISAYLRNTVGGEVTMERYTIQAPTGVPEGPLQLFVGDGTTITNTELKRGVTGAPKDLPAAIRELNKLRQNDRLYIKLVSGEPGVVIGGEEMPSLPPSMRATLGADRMSSRNVSPTSGSTVREYALPPSKFVIQGQRSLTLNVKP